VYMPSTLLKEKPMHLPGEELDSDKTSKSKVIDLVSVLKESLAKAQAKPLQKKLITRSTVKELTNGLAALIGTETPRTTTAFLVEVIFDGKRIRFKRADDTLFDLTRAGAELVEKAKMADGGAWTGL